METVLPRRARKHYSFSSRIVAICELTQICQAILGEVTWRKISSVILHFITRKRIFPAKKCGSFAERITRISSTNFSWLATHSVFNSIGENST